MLVHFEDILPEGIEIEVCLESDDPAARELNIKGPVTGSFEIKKTGQQFLVRGSVSGDVQLTCARCLTDFTVGVREGVDVELRPAIDLERAAQESELGSEDLNVEFFRGDALDISHLMAEQVSLCIPMKPLCRDDCSGICPECGVNRTLGACGCEPETDLRWSALKELKDRMNKK
jgi:uncharacterized protein